jgi:hypothetical protein
VIIGKPREKRAVSKKVFNFPPQGKKSTMNEGWFVPKTVIGGTDQEKESG